MGTEKEMLLLSRSSPAWIYTKSSLAILFSMHWCLYNALLLFSRAFYQDPLAVESPFAAYLVK